MCEDAAISGVETAGLAGVVGGSCALAPTGAGAVVCGGGLVVYAAALYRLDKKVAKCFATYPGPANW